MAPSKMTMLYVCLLAATLAVAQGQQLLSTIASVVQIGGVVTCSIDSSAATSGLPPFPNAEVALVCSGTTVTTVKTSGDGSFMIMLDVNKFPVTTLLTQCNVKVLTPLATCDASLPSVGSLVTRLTSIGSTVASIITVKVGIAGFSVTV